jgi:protein-disulfide isomerase/uncharacterized membrane protein
MPKFEREQPGDADALARAGGSTTITAGAVLLAISAAASGVLVYKHFGGRAPGCGPQSACDALEATIWGKVPVIDWPTSFVGLAFFLGMLAAWVTGRGRLPLALLGLMGVSVAASLLLLGVMAVEAKFCPYCISAHAGNLGFFAVAMAWRGTRNDERGTMSKEPVTRKRTRTRPPSPSHARRVAFPMAAGVGAAVFALVSGGLGVLEASHRERVAAKAEAERRESSSNIVAGTKGVPSQPADRWGAAGFTGRYRLGPEQAPIRIVMLTDYQCPDCKRVEAEASELLRTRSDVSLSIKYFPMCTDCNKYAGRTLHENACWAARAAETAGILGGDAAFWKMHRWLFDRGGRFLTQAELNQGIAAAGLEPSAFTAVLNSPETMKRVQADVEDGWALGLYFTPMVFINGVEMKGWQTPGALKRTVEEVAATTPPPPARTAAADRPVLAAEKFVQDWLDQPVRPMPPEQRAWTLASAESRVLSAEGSEAGAKVVEVVVFGDYQEQFTAKVDGEIRAAVASRPGGGGVRYTFRHYPVNKECNPALPANVPAAAIHPGACTAARAAEGAGSLGGEGAYWKMHQWLMERWQQALTPESLKGAAEFAGVDAGKLTAAMGSPEVAAAISEDCLAAQRLGVASIPLVFVDGRQVPRAVREGDTVVTRIIERALGGR